MAENWEMDPMIQFTFNYTELREYGPENMDQRVSIADRMISGDIDRRYRDRNIEIRKYRGQMIGQYGLEDRDRRYGDRRCQSYEDANPTKMFKCGLD
jgi:hypothetical protein